MPLTRRQVYFRRRLAVFTAAAVLLGSGFYLPLTLLAPLRPVAAVMQELDIPTGVPADLAWPSNGASGIGAVGFPGTLATTGSTDPLPIASITKIITALVVLDAHPIPEGATGQDITFTAADVAIRQSFLPLNGVVAPVRPGMVLSQREVLQVMLIESANNYAVTLATWAFGSEQQFALAATEWLDEHALAGTALRDATGMSPANRSTPADLIEIGKLALADPLLAEIVSTEFVSVDGVGSYTNRNRMLGVDGVKGIKTGTLDEAGACLLFAAELTVGDSTVTTVGVVLGAVDHASLNVQVAALLQDIRAGFHEVVLVEAGERLGTYTTAWGATADVVASSSATMLLWSDTPVTSAIDTDALAEGIAGVDVGDLTFDAGRELVTVDLELAEAIDAPGPWWRLANPLLLL